MLQNKGYDSLTIYYLNQIGIIPWIKKQSYEQTLKDSCPKIYARPTHIHPVSAEIGMHSSLNLVILTPMNQSQKAKILLEKIVKFVNWLSIKCTLVEFSSDDLDEALVHLSQNLSHLSVLLVLAENIEHCISNHHFKCPIFFNQAPVGLLKNSYAKKKIFKVLLNLGTLEHKCITTEPS